VALAVSIAAVTVLAGRAAGTAAERAGGPPRPSLVVRAGDTLWGIARDRVGPEGDPRPLVEAIREANDLGAGPLLVGQRIVLPPTS
jgi:nucleoid-associated protein YgaU